jgi:hypothetical protein
VLLWASGAPSLGLARDLFNEISRHRPIAFLAGANACDRHDASREAADIRELRIGARHGELLPLWWKGVYLNAERIKGEGEPKVGDRLRVRARGFLPYELKFILEPTMPEKDRRVEVITVGDFDGLWGATHSSRCGGVHVDIIWQVTVLRPILRLLAPLLRPAFAWNHRWTTSRGESGLQEYLAKKSRVRLHESS